MPPLRLVAPPLLVALLFACGGPPPPADATVSAATPAPASAPAAAPAPAASPAEADRHYLAALELEAAGRYVEARAEVELALASGAGRDATLLAAKLAILRDDLDAGVRLLTPLAASGDALVLYNLGLIAQRRGAYNDARSHYLAALKADPRYAPARYNLALLTWDAGIKEEAQHHARKFLELSPDDPRAAELRTRVGMDAGPAPAQPAPVDLKAAAARAPTKPGAADPGTGLKNPFEPR